MNFTRAVNDNINNRNQVIWCDKRALSFVPFKDYFSMNCTVLHQIVVQLGNTSSIFD